MKVLPVIVWCGMAGVIPTLSVAADAVRTVETANGAVTVDTIATGLDHPWGMAFLPDGRLLLTERAGRVRILDTEGRLSPPVAGTPRVYAQGQGGMLDVALDPEFASTGQVYLSFAEEGPDGACTALGRGRLVGNELEGFQVVFRQEPSVDGNKHFGGRVVFGENGVLFLTTGERFRFDPAQDLATHLGKIVRLTRDGAAAPGNPFAGQQGAKPEIWSYGHRNVESAAIDPRTKTLWVAEMGPMGGDELNRVEPGKNYGWPLVSWGSHYDGKDIPDPATRPDLTDAEKHWTPVISPSGMVLYDGKLFPRWRGAMIIGSLSTGGLVVLTFTDGKPASEQRVPLGARIRDVEQAPDGSIYVITDELDGKVWRLRPAP